jgi:hypothetical protein
MTIPKVRRRWIVLAVIVAVLFTSYRLLDSHTYIYDYRVIDDYTVGVETGSGPGAWVRVTSVVETPTTVTIVVSNFYFQLGPSTGLGIGYESVAKLKDPLGSRTLIDGKDGHAVERVACPSPAVFGVCP